MASVSFEHTSDQAMVDATDQQFGALLRRYRLRFEVHWQPRRAGSVVAVAVLALALATGASIGSEPATAATTQAAAKTLRTPLP